jgi:N-carbamoyl-L-amino-acid hydrolase
MTFDAMWEALLPVGRRDGAYHRYSWTDADMACRSWFAAEAARRDMPVRPDGNGNLFAWWEAGVPGEEAVLTGSHLDSVPGGGAFDGPLGVVSAFAAIDALRAEGFSPNRSIGVAAFAEEEGARFGVACLGSRLLTGAIEPERAAALRDSAGVTLAEAMAARGQDPAGLGPGYDLLRDVGCFVELHVEQGRALGGAVGVGSAIWPHGRWRMDFTGRGDHAGTTRLGDRRDPMLPFAETVLAVRAAAAEHKGVATVGKVEVIPGGVNAIPSRVRGWLDVRAPEEAIVVEIVRSVREAALMRGERHGTSLDFTEESRSAAVSFDHALRDRLAGALGDAPVLPTGAGHDAGILAAHVPTAMLFVRNPTGISHDPAEYAERDDCLAGVAALTVALRELA